MSEAETYDSRTVFSQQQEEAADKFRVCDNETVPSATGSPGVEEPVAMEGTSIASAGAGSVEMGVGRGPSSRVGEEMAKLWRISLVLVARKLLLLILLQGPLKTF